MLRESQQGPEAEGPAPSAQSSAAAAAPGNSAALAIARAVARHGLGNRATQALISRDSFSNRGSTQELHEQVYGDSSLAHGAAPEPKYEFSDDPLAADLTPADSIRVKPGPVRADLIRPKAPPLTKRGEWLENALKEDKLLKELPGWARDKAIDGLKDIDETIAEKIIDALPWDSNVKEAATAALKALLQTAKGKKFEMPVAPPNPRLPDWTKPQDFQAAPGQVIIPLPAIKW